MIIHWSGRKTWSLNEAKLRRILVAFRKNNLSQIPRNGSSRFPTLSHHSTHSTPLALLSVHSEPNISLNSLITRNSNRTFIIKGNETFQRGRKRNIGECIKHGNSELLLCCSRRNFTFVFRSQPFTESLFTAALMYL